MRIDDARRVVKFALRAYFLAFRASAGDLSGQSARKFSDIIFRRSPSLLRYATPLAVGGMSSPYDITKQGEGRARGVCNLLVIRQLVVRVCLTHVWKGGAGTRSFVTI